MTYSGLILVIVTICTIVIVCSIGLIFHFKHWVWKWWYTSFFALFCLVYFLSARWIHELINCVDYHFINKDDTMTNPNASILISKAFLLDMCPFLILILSLSSLAKQTRSFAKIIAPIALWTSLATLLLAISTNNEPLTVQYVFVGIYPNLMFFMMHYLMMILAMMLMMNTKRYKWWWFIIAFSFIFIYIAYIFFIKQITGVNWNLTGLTPNDWITVNTDFNPFTLQYETYYGEYEQLGIFFHLVYPGAAVFLFLVSAIGVIIFIALNSLIKYGLSQIDVDLYYKKLEKKYGKKIC